MPATLDRAPFREPVGQPRRRNKKRRRQFTVEARWRTAATVRFLGGDWYVWRRYDTEAKRDEGLRAITQGHSRYDFIEFRKGE